MNLNLSNIKEEWLNRENVLKYVNPYDVYSYYLGNFNINTNMNSPFREDNSPSFGIFLGRKGDLAFNDYKLGGGDCIVFVSFMENCDYKSALSIINQRHRLGLIDYIKAKSNIYTHKAINTDTVIQPKSDVWISIKVRNWLPHDKEYWNRRYEISGSTLMYFDVYPIDKFWINQFWYNADKYGYAYRFDTNVYKIYQPFLPSGRGKWWGNIKNKEIYQGHDQLIDNGELLFITSSLKDVMVLYEAGYSAIAPHTEHQILSEELYNHYSNRFDMIVIFYDNDSAGILHANKMVERYEVKSIILPESDTKDPSDFVEKYDLETLKLWISEKI